jgi:hypothetical protein
MEYQEHVQGRLNVCIEDYLVPLVAFQLLQNIHLLLLFFELVRQLSKKESNGKKLYLKIYFKCFLRTGSFLGIFIILFLLSSSSLRRINSI